MGYYSQALSRYQNAAALFGDDPRPLLYQRSCYERVTDITQSPEEKRQQFALGEAVLRKALQLKSDAPDYSPALPYRALASLYSHMNDFHSALDSLNNAGRRIRECRIDKIRQRHSKRRAVPLRAG